MEEPAWRGGDDGGRGNDDPFAAVLGPLNPGFVASVATASNATNPFDMPAPTLVQQLTGDRAAVPAAAPVIAPVAGPAAAATNPFNAAATNPFGAAVATPFDVFGSASSINAGGDPFAPASSNPAGSGDPFGFMDGGATAATGAATLALGSLSLSAPNLSATAPNAMVPSPVVMTPTPNVGNVMTPVMAPSPIVVAAPPLAFPPGSHPAEGASPPVPKPRTKVSEFLRFIAEGFFHLLIFFFFHFPIRCKSHHHPSRGPAPCTPLRAPAARRTARIFPWGATLPRRRPGSVAADLRSRAGAAVAVAAAEGCITAPRIGWNG
jgi:hypothetical protein